jgi:hypothetical protein
MPLNEKSKIPAFAPEPSKVKLLRDIDELLMTPINDPSLPGSLVPSTKLIGPLNGDEPSTVLTVADPFAPMVMRKLQSELVNAVMGQTDAADIVAAAPPKNAKVSANRNLFIILFSSFHLLVGWVTPARIQADR